jgi:flagellar FliJ protein
MSSTLHTLLEQAETERDAALARMQQADEAVRQSRAQSEQLWAYREDYRRRAPALNGKSATIELMRCHHGFMQRLDQAIDHQRGQLAGIEKQAVALRELLLEREMRVAAVKKLIERRAAEAMRVAARVDQRQTDEAAQRVSYGRADAYSGHANTQH